MIGVDWGTSSFRAFRLDAEGRVAERRAAPRGILAVEDGRFAEELLRQVGDWIAEGETRILMSGMIGSRQGWVEARYLACPAGPADIAGALVAVPFDGAKVLLVPGLTHTDAAGTPEVMRGEETQLAGVLGELGRDGVACLPGSHSKWARIEAGRIAAFATYLSGEAFAALRGHTILGRMMKDGPTDMSAFDRGLARSGDPGHLLHHLFGVRTLGLFGQLAGDRKRLLPVRPAGRARGARRSAPGRRPRASDRRRPALRPLCPRRRRLRRHRRHPRRGRGGARPRPHRQGRTMDVTHADLRHWLARCPLIAILRGVRPDEVLPIGEALEDAGIAIVEVPLNSPEPIESIRRLAQQFGTRMLIGAGTVMTPAQVAEIDAFGGRLIVMPHADTAVIGAAKAPACSPAPASPRPPKPFRAARRCGRDQAVSCRGEQPGRAQIPARGAAAGHARAAGRRHRRHQHGRLARRRRRRLRHRLLDLQTGRHARHGPRQSRPVAGGIAA